MNRILLACLLILAGLAFAQNAASGESTEASEESSDAPTMAEILRDRPEVSMFAELMETTGMIHNLERPGAFTLFVPTNDAMQALGEEALDEIRSDTGVIEMFLRDHVAMGNSSSAALERMNAFTGLTGYQYLIERRGETLYVNGVPIVTPDLEAENGYVHIIDGVIAHERFWPRKNQNTVPAGDTPAGRGSD